MSIKNNNQGVSLLELIIAITIMAVLVGILAPQYIKYLRKSEKTTDVTTASRIGDVLNRAMIDYPEAFQAFDEYQQLRKSVSVTVDGKKERYDVFYVMVNEDKFNYWFYGGPSMTCFFWKNENDIGLYNYINREFGFEGEVKGSNPNWTAVRMNTAMSPQYKLEISPTGDKGHKARLDRWRIVKRVDNGNFEVWSACNLEDGQSHGGKAIYRVWPNPDDVYTK